jgi:hypothetical protein
MTHCWLAFPSLVAGRQACAKTLAPYCQGQSCGVSTALGPLRVSQGFLHLGCCEAQQPKSQRFVKQLPHQSAGAELPRPFLPPTCSLESISAFISLHWSGLTRKPEALQKSTWLWRKPELFFLPPQSPGPCPSAR